MHRLPTLIVAGLLALLVAPPSAVCDDSVRIPGTQVSLVPPDTFELARRFAGVQNEQLRASIVVSEIPTALEELRSGLTQEQLAPRGMALEESEATRFGTHEGQLARVQHTLDGAVYEKWMGLLGDGSKSVLVVATYPRALADMLRAQMRASVVSATWDPALTLDAFDSLPFRIQIPEKLAIVRSERALLTLSTPGTELPVPPTEPWVVLGPSTRSVAIDDLAEFSQQRLSQTVQVQDIESVEGATLEIDGRPAYELVANAKDKATGADLRLYQVIVAAGEDYTIVQGACPFERGEEFLPEMKLLARSLEFR